MRGLKSNSRSSGATAVVVKNVNRVLRSLLNRSINSDPCRVEKGKGHYYILADKSEIYDASGGAAVNILDKDDDRPINAAYKIRREGLSYCPGIAFDTDVTEALARKMIEKSEGKFAKACFYGSGSEAAEAALKLVVQYFGKEKYPNEPKRTIILSRDQSYHGNTLGALDLSGHEARRQMYTSVLPKNRKSIPACHPYRNRKPGQTDEAYVQWHKEQLIATIESEGKDRIAALILEPVVGAALGCAPAVPGYLKAMREVCDCYGIVLIFDEIMCGIGRTGHFFAWQEEGIVPDIVLNGKALASGFEQISSMLVGHKIIKTFQEGPSDGAFNHGHTFQNSPAPAAAALKVLEIIEEEDLIGKTSQRGPLLQKKLRGRLQGHRYVGDIRGPSKGAFIGIEFVKDKFTKQPFDVQDGISMALHKKGLTKPHSIFVYPGSGCADGISGDHVILAPAYNISSAEVDLIVQRFAKLVEDFFDEYDATHAMSP